MDQLQWVIASFGAVALIGIFVRMNDGLGPFTLRAIGIIFVGTISSLLALKDTGSLSAAMSILGAIAGYLFGIKETK